MEIKFKKLNDKAVEPKYAHNSDACVDLTVISREYDNITKCYVYGTGLAFELPENTVGLLFARSSICNKDMILSNHVGIIDSGYLGEVKAKFRTTAPNHKASLYEIGERALQLMVIPRPKMTFTEVSELGTSERGTGGFGSSGA